MALNATQNIFGFNFEFKKKKFKFLLDQESLRQFHRLSHIYQFAKDSNNTVY